MESATAEKRRLANAAALALAADPFVLAVALFGSVARGDAHEHSDVDLLVLVDDARVPRSTLGLNPEGPQSHPDVAVSTYTLDELGKRLHRWTRFAAHLRSEGVVLHDPGGTLTSALQAEIPISIEYEVQRSERHLDQFSQLDRFGSRMLFPLARIYSVGRTASLARLSLYGRLEFDQESAFDALRDLDPSLADDIQTIRSLRPFYELVRDGTADRELPFEPVGFLAQSKATEAREAAKRLLEACRDSSAIH